MVTEAAQSILYNTLPFTRHLWTRHVRLGRVPQISFGYHLGNILGHSVIIWSVVKALTSSLTQAACSCRAARRGQDIVTAICQVQQTLIVKGRKKRDALLLFDP